MIYTYQPSVPTMPSPPKSLPAADHPHTRAFLNDSSLFHNQIHALSLIVPDKEEPRETDFFQNGYKDRADWKTRTRMILLDSIALLLSRTDLSKRSRSHPSGGHAPQNEDPVG